MIAGWELAGLSLAQLLTVLGGFGLGVIGLYLLRLQRRRIEVPFVGLWDRVLGEERTTRLAARLRRLISLLIALTIVALVAIALGDPRPAGALRDGRTFVLLLDASASMQARELGATESRAEGVRREARAFIDGLNASDRVLVARMGPRTLPLGPRSGDPAELETAIAGYDAADIAASLRSGLRFALDALAGAPHPEIVILSDGLAGEAGDMGERAQREGVPVRWVRVGQSDAEATRNVAITAFAARRHVLDRSRAQVLLELWNPGERAEDVEVTLLGDGRELDVATQRLGAGERSTRVFEDVSGADRTLEARVRLRAGDVTAEDALPADDVAYARLPERRRARILRVSAGDVYLDAALLLDEYLDVVEAAPGAPVPSGHFDVVIYDGGTLAGSVDADEIWLAPMRADTAGAPLPFELGERFERPHFERVRAEHPLVRFVSLRDVNASSAERFQTRAGDVVVGADPRGALLVVGQRDAHRFVALAFAPSESDLPMRVAWPLLVLNAIDFLTEEEAGFHASRRTDETWHLPVPAGATRATLISPSGEEREVPIVAGHAIASGQRAGFWRLRTDEADAPHSDAASESELFAVSLGPSDEAALALPDHLQIGDAEAEPPEAARAGLRSEIWSSLLLLALLILGLEWATYHRRWTL